MDAAKVQLSQEERALLMNPDWILTKNSIMARVGELLARLSGQQQEIFSLRTDEITQTMKEAGQGPETAGFPTNWDTPKISKGENYKGLPWIVLDYPRAFGREDVLAIRTFFWWGHYFSVTLHLKGKYKDLLVPVIRQHITLLAQAGFHIGVSEDEWRHELDSDGYRPLQKDMDTETLKERVFLKLSAKCGLDRWDEASSVLLELFRVLVGVLTASPATNS